MAEREKITDPELKSAIAGIDIGGTKIKFGLVLDNDKILHKWSIDMPARENEKYTSKLICNSLKEHCRETQVVLTGIGIDVPGVVNPKNNKVYDCTNLGWENGTDIKVLIQKEFPNIPIVLANDANAAAIGEKWQGKINDSNLFFVTLGTGVGGALILNNQIFHGSFGYAGEFGHVFASDNGLRCTCGNYGCLETISSATAISQAYQRTTGKKLSTKEIFSNAENGEDIAKNIIDEATNYLAIAIANVVNVVNVSEVIIGGGVADAGDFLLNKVITNMKPHLFIGNKKKLKIKLATLKNNAGIFGMVLLVRNQREDKINEN